MISILTPTYNRKSTLPRLYQSLCEQAGGEFEWVIVDDGSSDGTDILMSAICKEAPIRIKYHQQSNSGKHVAVNNGLKLCDGDWVFIVDSDDALKSNAIPIIRETLQRKFVSSCVGLCFRREYFSGEFVGVSEGSFKDEPIKSTPTDASRLFKGDLAYLFKKKEMLEEPFPVINGEKFVPELYIWNRISDRGDVMYFPETSIYRCDYLEDGYSRNFWSNLRKNPKGFYLFYSTQIRRETALIAKFKCLVRAVQCLWFSRGHS